jgi:hypothetical protein
MGSNGHRLVEPAYAWGIAAERMRSVYGWLIIGGATRPDCVTINQTVRHYA